MMWKAKRETDREQQQQNQKRKRRKSLQKRRLNDKIRQLSRQSPSPLQLEKMGDRKSKMDIR